MINFRFHLVSLIAIFLALGLGILVGSSVVDQVIVDQLHRDINGARHDSKAANDQLGQKTDELNRTADALTKSAPFSVDQRLPDVPVALIAEKGVDAGMVQKTLQMLKDAGASVPGVLWLQDSWRLDSTTDLDALHAAAGVTGNNATARVAALRLLAQRLAQPAASGRKKLVDVIQSLRDAHFLDFTDGDKNALAKFPVHSARALLITGTDSRLAGNAALVDLTSAFLAAGVPTTVDEIYNDHNNTPPVPQRGASLAPIRGDSTLAKSVSTLDDGELVQGQVTAVIALEQLVGGTVGHYGYGTGAQSFPQPNP